MFKSKGNALSKLNINTVLNIGLAVGLFIFIRRIVKSLNTISPDPYDNNNDWIVFRCGTARQDQPTLNLIEIRLACEEIKSHCSVIIPWENEEAIMNALKKCCTDKDFQNMCEYYPRAEGALFVTNVLINDVKNTLNDDEQQEVNSYFTSKGMRSRL
jgi:hypothetical protein